MNFIERFRNGWRLFVCSLGVMGRNKTLLLFPAATAALTIVIAALFLTPVALQPTGHPYAEPAHWAAIASRLFSSKARAIAFFAPVYFLSMFLATFFNAAFVHEIFNALDGKPVSVGGGLRSAAAKIKPILLWSLFAGLVGALIKTLEEKFGFFGRLVVRSIGLAWSVASVFVIPVLVMEEYPGNPVDVVRQSAGVIRKTWGEALGGYAGLQFGGMLVALSAFVVIPASFYAGLATGHWGLMLAGLLGWLAAACAFSYVMGVAGRIYLCVLYRFASAGVVPDGYTPEMLSLAWKPRKN